MISRNVSLLKIAKSAKSLHPSVERPEYKSYLALAAGIQGIYFAFCVSNPLKRQSHNQRVSTWDGLGEKI